MQENIGNEKARKNIANKLRITHYQRSDLHHNGNRQEYIDRVNYNSEPFL